MVMDVHYIKENGEIDSITYTKNYDKFYILHKIGERYLHPSFKFRNKIVTTDMDGVLIVDDNALDLCKIIAGDEGVNYFKQVSDSNIKAVARGETSYCWNSPAVFVGSLLKSLPTSINSIVGTHMRFVPGAKENIEHLLDLRFHITNVTAGHQEGAEMVSYRLGIKDTVATQFGVENGVYTGEISRFVGGIHKLNEVKKILANGDDQLNGMHVGDSHSDIETMQAHRASIAWNPAHDLAVNSAKINVFGFDKRGLTPFYDINGKFDEDIAIEMLPKVVVVNHLEIRGVNSNLTDLMIKTGQDMRKMYAEQIERRTPYALMRKSIEDAIREETGYDTRAFKRHIESRRSEIYLPIDEFQRRAEIAYKRV